MEFTAKELRNKQIIYPSKLFLIMYCTDLKMVEAMILLLLIIMQAILLRK